MKSTLHVQRLLPWQRGTMESWGSAWAKIVNPPESGVSPWPNQKVIVRWWTDNIDSQYISRGYDGGVSFVQDMLSTWSARPYAAAYSLWNEPECNDAWWLQRLAAASRGAMDEATRRSIKVVILETSESNPSGGDPYSVAVQTAKIKVLTSAVKQAVEQGHYIGAHAYWRPGVEGPTGKFHALGHVEFMARAWGEDGVDLDRTQLLVTETGIDGGIAGHQTKQGWRALTTLEGYASQITEAEVYARALPYVKALMFFTAGCESEWRDFDLDEGNCRVIGAKLTAIPAPLPSPLPLITPEYVAETRKHRLILNPNAGLKNAIEAAGQCCASCEFDASSEGARQYGFKDNWWYMWEWRPGQSCKIVYREEAER